MTMLTHIAVCLSREVMGSTAYQRWNGIKHIESDTGFISNEWVKLAILVLLVGSVISFVVIGILRKVSERKTAAREFADGVARRGLTPAETDTLIEIAIKAGLKRMADIFVLSDAFERGLDILFKGSFVDGNSTNKTVELERHLANLKAKMSFRKVAKGGGYYPSVSAEKSNKPVPTNSAVMAKGGGYYPGVSAEKSNKPVPTNSAVIKTAFIAMFPFSMKMDLINSGSTENHKQGYSPPDWQEQLPKFMPATITGLVGRVLFIETALSANVGDRVLIAVGSCNAGDGSGIPELVQDIGTVEQSIHLAESLKERDVFRIGVKLGLSESQAVHPAGAVKGISPRKTEGKNAGDSVEAETENMSGPVDSKEGAK
jgi:hypothetical protein